MENYFKMLAFLRGHKGLFVAAVVTMLLANAFEVFSFSLFIPLIDIVFTGRTIEPPTELPQFLDDLINRLNAMDPNDLLNLVLPGFLIMLILKNIFVFAYQYWMSDVSQRVMRDIRSQLYQRVLALSLGYFTQKRTGELVSRITFDANLIENAVSYGLTDIVRQTFFIVLWVISAVSIDPKAAVIVFVVFPVIGYPMSRIGKRLRKISEGVQEKMADINSFLLETISGIKVVKAFSMEDNEFQRFVSQNQDYYKLKLKSIKRLVLLSPMTEIFAGIAVTVMIYWYSQRVLSGELSLGVFIFFIASVMSIIRPVKKLGNANALIQQALSANKRIYEVLNADVTVKEAQQPLSLPEFSQQIEFRNVEFTYSRTLTLQCSKGSI
jgi:subfamily B ATP-binding cassette protein MsbA